MLTYQSNVARALDQVRIIPFAAGISSLATLIGAFVFIAQLRLGVEGYFIATILGGVCGRWYTRLLANTATICCMLG